MKSYYLIPFCFALTISFYASAQKGKSSAVKDQPKTLEQLLTEFCLANDDAYHLIKQWIRDNKGKNTAISPLAMDPSCHDCHDPDQYKKDTAAIHKWMEASNKPESEKIVTLLKMEKDWVILKGSIEKTTEVPKCFNDFSTEDFNDMVLTLARRVYDRVIAMARKNKGYPQYAFPGITYLLSVTREFAMIGGIQNDNEGMQLAGDWLQTCYKQFDTRLLKNYQYQLYPSYFGLIRELALTGVETKFDDAVEWMKKMDDFMHFNLRVEFEASGHGDNGGQYHALVSGETEVQCKLQEGGCYVWEPVNGNSIDFTVKEVIFKSDQGSAVYKTPQVFSAPITLKVNMCADNPTFKIALGSFGDASETYSTSDGADFQSPLLYSLAIATLGSANLNRMQSEAQNIRQKADQFKGREAEIDAAARRLNEHKNDPNYLKTPQGKSDMSLMKEMAKSQGYDPNSLRPDPERMKNLEHLRAMNAKQKEINQKYTRPAYVGSAEYQNDKQELSRLKSNVNMTDLTTAIGFDANVLEIQAPFTIGIPKPVDKIQKDKIKEVAGSQNGWEFGQFHITLEKK